MTRDPLKRAFADQKYSASTRSIEFHFTFETWLLAWTLSGKLPLRGIGRGRYVMARIGDKGPYAPWNVEFITHEQNSIAARVNFPRTTSELSRKLIGRGKGWTFRNGRYQVMCATKYVGVFGDQASAETAYEEAVAMRLASFNPLFTESIRTKAEQST